MTTAPAPSLRAKKEAAIIACLEAGDTPAQIRRKVNVSSWIIRRVRKKAGLPAPTHGPSESTLTRQEQAMELRRQGFTLNEIGAMLVPPVTGKRVHQLLKGTGATFVCAKCGEPALHLHFYHENCTPHGAEGICPACAQKVRQPQTKTTA